MLPAKSLQSYGIPYMWDLKEMMQINLLTNRKRLADLEDEILATEGKG